MTPHYSSLSPSYEKFLPSIHHCLLLFNKKLNYLLVHCQFSKIILLITQIKIITKSVFIECLPFYVMKNIAVINSELSEFACHDLHGI